MKSNNNLSDFLLDRGDKESIDNAVNDFKNTINNGNLNDIKLLLEATKTDAKLQKEMLKSCKDEVVRKFKLAVDYNMVDIVKLLLEAAKTGTKLQKEMIEGTNYEPFKTATSLGYIESVKLLLEATKPLGIQKQMIKSDGYRAFDNAVENNNGEIVKLLLEAAESFSMQEEMIKYRNYKLFTKIIANGYTGVTKLLLEASKKYPEMQKEMLKGTDYTHFKCAAIRGYAETVKLLLEAAEPLGIQKEMIENFFNFINNNYKVTKEILTLLKFADVLNKHDVSDIKAIINEHQNDEWLKEIIHFSGDKAMKLMVEHRDIEAIKLLLRLDLTYKWHLVDKSQVYQEAIENEWFDATNKDLISFSQITKHPLKAFSKLHKSKEFVNSYIVTFLTGGTVKYMPDKIKALQSCTKGPAKANDKYKELVQKHFDKQPDCDVIEHTEETVNNTEITTLGMAHNYDSEVG